MCECVSDVGDSRRSESGCRRAAGRQLWLTRRLSALALSDTLPPGGRSLFCVVGADLVIFDLDDTLFNHVGAARDAVAAWLLNRDVEPTEELIGVWFDAEARNIALWHRGELDWQGQRRARIAEMLDAIGARSSDSDSLDRLFGDYLAHYEAGWSAFPDVEPMLEELEREQIRIAVLTNGADYQQRQKLAAIGLEHRVGPVYCSDVIGFAKPDVRAFRHVCEQLGTDPSVAVSVGDRYDLDVVAARDAGLSAVHLDRNETATGDERHRIHTLSDLLPLLTNSYRSSGGAASRPPVDNPDASCALIERDQQNER